MNLFYSMILYVVIGGVVASSMNNHNVEKCDDFLDDNTAMLVVFGWPAILPIAIIADEPNKHTTLCEGDD